MKLRLLFFALALALLGLGMAAGIWIEREKPVPAPPGRGMAELTTPAVRLRPAESTPKMMQLTPITNRRKLVAAIRTIRPKITHYHAQLRKIETDFDQALLGVLNDAQQARYKSLAPEIAPTHGLVPAPPLTTEEILRLRDRPAYRVTNMVVIAYKLDWLTSQLDLDPSQVDAARDLLKQRRESFIALLDHTSPPSLMLSDLATVAQRLTPANSD